MIYNHHQARRQSAGLRIYRQPFQGEPAYRLGARTYSYRSSLSLPRSDIPSVRYIGTTIPAAMAPESKLVRDFPKHKNSSY